MTLGTLVQDMLTDDAGVAALVGTRVYPVALPQTPTYPAISYQRISTTPQGGSTTLRVSRYQINCWATSYGGVQSLANAVITAAEEHRDGSETPVIKQTITANVIDDYDPDVKIYRTMVDVFVTTTGE